MEDPDHIFGNGLYLANLAVSTNILIDSWKVISEYQGKNHSIITRKHQDYNIIAFVSSPVTTAAFSQFNSLRGEFSELQQKDKNEEPILYIITGHCLNGSVASLFTLRHLNKLDPTKWKLLCITFGSPLLGDNYFQQALSRHPTWNSCFLHVVHKDDYVPICLGPSYKPFDTYEAGITAQVTAVGLWQSQQDEGISALIKNIAAHEKFVIKQQREELDPAELEEMKVYLTFWSGGRRCGEEASTTECTTSEQVAFGGTNYRRIVEPLDIAEYYRRGRKDYLTRGRSKHYERLEKWLEDSEKARKKGKETQEKSEKAGQKGKETRMVLLNQKRRKRPFDFEHYVMDLIEREKVSSDIFLEKSSYMQWWREYREIMNKKVVGSHSHHSELINYMMEGRYKDYGKPSQINSNGNPSDTSHLGPSTSGDPRG
ncbi:hypothetical protein NL676_036564 [Syzygium grande]|nr:hypothetical protein NL676_036564 [Syzygium grande]